MTYYVISTSEDGEVSLSVVDEAGLQAKLDENYWGKTKFKKVEDNFDIAAEGGLIVIRGEAVSRRPARPK